MKEHGLIFSSEMIRAFLEHRKSMTRRTQGLEKINEDPNKWHLAAVFQDGKARFFSDDTEDITIKCPYAVGDLIYAKETHAFEKWLDDRPTREITTLALRNIWYKASDYFASIALNRGRWRSAMFMPKFAARIRREIIAIRCVRVQDITEEDAKAEGGTRPPNYSLTPYYREWFKYLWNRLNGKKHPWEHNDWVWVLSLKEVER